MRKILKKIVFPFLKIGFDQYYKKPRKYAYEHLEVLVHPEVFPPHFTISSKILLDFLKPLDLDNKTFLELGCGSGIISLFAASKSAIVTASDINTVAIEALKVAAKKQELSLNVVYSDLFDELLQEVFDYIIINPPYYPKAPESEKERAWYCGEDFEYFEKLFKQLPNQLAEHTLMILSEDCELDRIQKIAQKNGLTFDCVLTKKVASEKNFIFKIQKI